MEQDEIAALTEAVAMLRKEQQSLRQMLEEWMLEDTIGKAAEQYARKMAVVRGGFQ